MLTAAVRELHRSNPGIFATDVRTSCPELWENNPHLTPLRETGRGVTILDCEYPLIHESNTRPVHCLNGFAEFLANRLGVPCSIGSVHGDIHLSRREVSAPSRIRRLTGVDLPYWLIVSGGKLDYTIKWWDPRRYQSVVDHFAGRLLFVQVGLSSHPHPALKGVMDLRGRTTLRQLVRLVHRARGVVCPVTGLMHLAAAVPVPNGHFPNRPCVVVAGGREPPHWEAYPSHQFIHTVGMLSCCSKGGCWRARTVPLHDGDDRDAPNRICVDVVDGLPRCMDLISADEVIRRIELYLQAGAATELTSNEIPFARAAVEAREAPGGNEPLPEERDGSRAKWDHLGRLSDG